jgi:hypothetical protein
MSLRNFAEKGTQVKAARMKRVLKRLRETRTGDSAMRGGITVVFAKNDEAWKGRIADTGTLRNGKTLYCAKNAVSDSGKVQSFDIEGKEIIKTITDLETERGFYGEKRPSFDTFRVY